MSPSRFADESHDPVSGERTLQWLLRKNNAVTVRQLLAAFGAVSILSLVIASGFWHQGAPWVLPFAGAEALALGLAALLHARHAADGEDIRLGRHALSVFTTTAGRTERVEFQPEWVRVEPEHGDGSLVELSGQGRRVAVGRFVRPDLRRQLAEELRWALRRWHPDVAHAAT